MCCVHSHWWGGTQHIKSNADPPGPRARPTMAKAKRVPAERPRHSEQPAVQKDVQSTSTWASRQSLHSRLPFRLEQVTDEVEHGLLAIASLLPLGLVVEADDDTLTRASNAGTTSRSACKDDLHFLALDLKVLLANEGVLDATEPDSTGVTPFDTVRDDLPENVRLVDVHLLLLVITDDDPRCCGSA